MGHAWGGRLSPLPRDITGSRSGEEGLNSVTGLPILEILKVWRIHKYGFPVKAEVVGERDVDHEGEKVGAHRVFWSG